MFLPLTVVRQPGRRFPAWLLAVMLILTSPFAPSPLGAQNAGTDEITPRDVAPAFKLKAERNLVLVHVVVRNSRGETVDSLGEKDFQLFDRGKLQIISHFSTERPALEGFPSSSPKAAGNEVTAELPATGETAAPAGSARRFVALYFDDVNTPLGSLGRARDAADHFLAGGVRRGDRVALYTSSGQKQVDFTDDVAQIHQALLELRPRPIAEKDDACGAVPPYEAYLIVDHQDPAALNVAMHEILFCILPGGTQRLTAGEAVAENQAMTGQARSMVTDAAMRSLTLSETQSTAALRGIETVVRRLMLLPGQRSIVVVSGGFMTLTLRSQLEEVADRALRGGVILNAIDARGLWTDRTITDASRRDDPPTLDGADRAMKDVMLIAGEQRQADGMQALAYDTGGVFFNNDNDLEAGFRKTAGLPETYYLLAFSPQNLKHDGAFHPLQVKLAAPKGLSVQARRGYFAPPKSADAAAQEKAEILEAVYSHDETRELPVDVHTEFFMKSRTEAQVDVLTHVDLHQLAFRQEGDRHLDNLNLVVAMFDQDGHFVAGKQKELELHLRDATLEKYLRTGITIQSEFDVNPGTYEVRSVVRESESGEISALNLTLEIPY